MEEEPREVVHPDRPLAGRLGHANPSLLFNTHEHLILEAAREAARRLERSLGS